MGSKSTDEWGWIAIDRAPLIVDMAFALAAMILVRLGLNRGAHALALFVCWCFGHEWADELKWGVEPVCLRCEQERGG